MRQASGDTAPLITASYLLTLNIALVRDHEGRYFADASWAKDLMLHTEYLTNLTLVCPYIRGTPPDGWVEIVAPTIRIKGYVTSRRGIGQYLALALLLGRLLVEVPRARIVHTGIAGYPIPPAWFAVPLARVLRKLIVIPVESAFWRLPQGVHAAYGNRVKAIIWECINRYCLRQADYATYSQADYRESLPSPRADGGELFQASWIDDDVILPTDVIAGRIATRQATSGRFLFATRMIPEKGTAVLAGALAILAERQAELLVDIVGEGPELSRFTAIAALAGWGRSHVRVLEPLAYGPEFFSLLCHYDAVLIPSLSDEQPRIVYDAASQGVASIASATAGTRACILDGETGILVAGNDPVALADAIQAGSANLAFLHALGLESRDRAALYTHRGMHRQRANGLTRMLAREPA